MNLQNVLYILAIIYMVSYLLVLIGVVVAALIISRKIKRIAREMEIRKNAVGDWIKYAPLVSILSIPVRKLVKKLIS